MNISLQNYVIEQIPTESTVGNGKWRGYYYITIYQQKTFLQNCPVQQKNLNQPLLKSLCSRKLIWLLDVYRDIHAWIYSYLMIITLTFYKKNYLKPIKLLFFWMTLTLTF